MSIVPYLCIVESFQFLHRWRLGSLWRCGGLLHETKTQNDMGEKTRKGWYWNETKRRMGKRNRRMNFVFEK